MPDPAHPFVLATQEVTTMQQTFSEDAPATFWARTWTFILQDLRASGPASGDEAQPRGDEKDRLVRDESFYWGFAPYGL